MEIEEPVIAGLRARGWGVNHSLNKHVLSTHYVPDPVSALKLLVV